MCEEDFARVNRHRAVHVNAHLRSEPPGIFQLGEVIDHKLRAPHGKGWNDDSTAARQSPLHNIAQRVFRRLRIVLAIPVSRFDEDVICRRRRHRIRQQRIAVAANVAREHDGLPWKLEF